MRAAHRTGTFASRPVAPAGNYPLLRPLAFLIAGIAASAYSYKACAQETHFDTTLMKQRGLDPKIADYFRDTPRFTPGIHNVALIVNGNRKGHTDMVFDAEGQPCITATLLTRAGLSVPRALKAQLAALGTADSQTTCFDYHQSFPSAVVNASPGNNTVSIVVPEEALAPPTFDIENYARGGNGAMLNYDLRTSTSRFSGRNSQYFQSDAELGFNTHDWIVRSRQSFASTDGHTSWLNQYAYAQHTFVDYKSVLQVGQINVVDTPFAIGGIYGVQIFPETALANPIGSGARVQGIALSQARVEVRQLGALVRTTEVPPGPFTLNDLPLRSNTADLTVTVIESNGEQRSFIVPAASFMNPRVGPPEGFAMAIGRLQSYGQDIDTPWLVTASRGWKLLDRANFTTGALISSPYQAVALGFEFSFLTGITGTTTILVSNSTHLHSQGAQINSALSASWSNWNANVTTSRQTPGYHDLTDVIQRTADPADPLGILQNGQQREQYTASAGWSGAMLGGFSAGYSRSTTFRGETSQQISASWSRSFKRVSMALNYQHVIGGGRGNINALFASVTIPFGRSTLNSYVNHDDGSTRMGSRYNQTVNPWLNYSLGYERNQATHQDSGNASVNAIARYTQLGLTASSSGSDSTYVSASMTGGILAQREGVVFSPYSVRDTFGVASVSHIGGVQIDTPSGPVWTDRWGHAALPSLAPYANSRVEIATKSLPRNVDINNGLDVVAAGHGSVSHVDFSVVKVRRLLLTAKLPDGSFVEKGAMVADEHENYVTAVGNNGAVFLGDAQNASPLHVVLSNSRQCRLTYQAPEKPEPNSFYDSAEALCAP